MSNAYTRRLVAPPKRKSGGRTTPKGTRPGETPPAGAGALPARSTTTTRGGSSSVTASSRYTPPVPQAVKESPRWVPVMMGVFLVVGALMIMGRYLLFSDSNWPLFAGLALVLAGLYTATRWH